MKIYVSWSHYFKILFLLKKIYISSFKNKIRPHKKILTQYKKFLASPQLITLLTGTYEKVNEYE